MISSCRSASTGRCGNAASSRSLPGRLMIRKAVLHGSEEGHLAAREEGSDLSVRSSTTMMYATDSTESRSPSRPRSSWELMSLMISWIRTLCGRSRLPVRMTVRSHGSLWKHRTSRTRLSHHWSPSLTWFVLPWQSGLRVFWKIRSIIRSRACTRRTCSRTTTRTPLLG